MRHARKKLSKLAVHCKTQVVKDATVDLIERGGQDEMLARSFNV